MSSSCLLQRLFDDGHCGSEWFGTWNSMLHLPPLPFPSRRQKPTSFLPQYSNSSPFAARNWTPGCIGFIGTSGIQSAGQQLAPAPEPPTTAITSTFSTCPTFQIVPTSTTSSISPSPSSWTALALRARHSQALCPTLPHV